MIFLHNNNYTTGHLKDWSFYFQTGVQLPDIIIHI